MKLKNFEAEVQKVLQGEFMKRCQNLKSSNVIFNPFFYILFTRIVELFVIEEEKNEVNKVTLEELFYSRKSTLQIDYSILIEIFRRIEWWKSRENKQYLISEHMEDILYIVYRIGDIQDKIDECILKYFDYGVKDIYYTLIKVLIELDDEARNQ